jgi:hypothetical protein
MMAGWTTVLAADPTEWLLKESNPSIRYLTLKNIFDRRDADPAVQRAKAEIMRTGIVPRILSKGIGESWNTPNHFYRDKYRGTVWQLIILAEHEADGENNGLC